MHNVVGYCTIWTTGHKSFWKVWIIYANGGNTDKGNAGMVNCKSFIFCFALYFCTLFNPGVWCVGSLYHFHSNDENTFWISDLKNSPASHPVLSFAKVFPVTDSILKRDARLVLTDSQHLELTLSLSKLICGLTHIFLKEHIGR